MTITREPCEICGDVGERHHDDYTKPDEWRWLCRKHHRQFHAQHPGKTLPGWQPKSQGYKQLNAWVSDQVAAELEKIAAEDDRSVSSIVRRLIVEFLQEQDRLPLEAAS